LGAEISLLAAGSPAIGETRMLSMLGAVL